MFAPCAFRFSLTTVCMGFNSKELLKLMVTNLFRLTQVLKLRVSVSQDEEIQENALGPKCSFAAKTSLKGNLHSISSSPFDELCNLHNQRLHF